MSESRKQEDESAESLRHQLDMHQRNLKLCRVGDRLRFQIEIERIERRLAELEKKTKPPAGG